MTGPAREASVLAETLARLAGNLASAGRPFDLWTPPLTPRAVRAAAGRVVQGAAEVLWADRADPDQGLMLYTPSAGETAFFGYGCARLAGPYLPPEDQERREAKAARLAALAAARARERGDRLVTLKTGQDPAALRGLLAGGFGLAENLTVLALDLDSGPDRSAEPPPGFIWLEPGWREASALVDDLGDFFYDGHLRHDSRPGPEAARRIWRRAALASAKARDRGDRLVTLKTGQDPAVLRGLLANGFVLAETLAVLTLDLALDPDSSTGPPPGYIWLERGEKEAASLVDDLGDFFYDGHLRHDPRPGPEAARRIWRRAALDDLAGAADEAVILWDSAARRGAGLATASLGNEAEAVLSILALGAPYRGQGLGRPLLLELIRRLRGKASRLRAETAAYNLPALALYQALGFRLAPPLAALHLHY